MSDQPKRRLKAVLVTDEYGTWCLAGAHNRNDDPAVLLKEWTLDAEMGYAASIEVIEIELPPRSPTVIKAVVKCGEEVEARVDAIYEAQCLSN